MKTANTVFAVVFCMLALVLFPRSAAADVIAREQVDAFAFQMGIDPDMDSFEQNEALRMTSFSGTVTAPCKMESLGFKSAKKGEHVEMICQDSGEWLGRILDTGEERTFKIRIDWGKKD
jgi:hypothetical protein